MSISINEHILAKRRWFFQCVFILVLAIVLVGVGGEQQKVFAQDPDDDGSDAEAEAASIRPATPVGLNIIVLRGQEPNVTINGNPVGTEGAATHGVGLDGFLLGFLANND